MYATWKRFKWEIVKFLNLNYLFMALVKHELKLLHWLQIVCQRKKVICTCLSHTTIIFSLIKCFTLLGMGILYLSSKHYGTVSLSFIISSKGPGFNWQTLLKERLFSFKSATETYNCLLKVTLRLIFYSE